MHPSAKKKKKKQLESIKYFGFVSLIGLICKQLVNLNEK